MQPSQPRRPRVLNGNTDVNDNTNDMLEGCIGVKMTRTIILSYGRIILKITLIMSYGRIILKRTTIMSYGKSTLQRTTTMTTTTTSGTTLKKQTDCSGAVMGVYIVADSRDLSFF